MNLKPALQLRHDNAAYSVAFSSDAGLLATGSLDKSIRVWELPSGAMKFQMKGHGEAICSVSFQTANQLLLSAGLDRTLRTWNLSTGKIQSTMSGHSAYLTCMAVLPDGAIAVSVLMIKM